MLQATFGCKNVAVHGLTIDREDPDSKTVLTGTDYNEIEERVNY